MTGPDALPEDLAAWPTHVPAPAVLGQVELLLAGIGRPTWVTVDVPASVRDASVQAGHLVLTDEEGTPLAEVAVENAMPGPDEGFARVAGSVRALRPFRAGPFRALRRRPDEIRRELAGGAAVAVALGRPLTVTEERALAGLATGRGARLLVLPCVADTGPSGLPPEVLVRAVRASLPRLATPAGAALLVPLPLAAG
ncbi:MAG: hypothetical protein ACRDVN_14665, partial [Jiangellaceae bacterium]